ncbi:MAG: hypothetical protein ACRC1M_06235 [Methanobacteriaceae archaeon]
MAVTAALCVFYIPVQWLLIELNTPVLFGELEDPLFFGYKNEFPIYFNYKKDCVLSFYCIKRSFLNL